MLEVELHPRHRKLYQTHLQRERQKVLGLHGGLVDDAHADLPCSKIDVLLEQLRDVAGGGHRALVFSQFTGFLDKVRERLDAAGVQYCYLDGTTRRRASVLARFKDGSMPVFLITLKAGGAGLNLTEADYCFLLDPWWNPATEAQAADRIRRIGQTRNVMVYRLIAAGTIEEKVMALKTRKAELFSASSTAAACSGPASTPTTFAACWPRPASGPGLLGQFHQGMQVPGRFQGRHPGEQDDRGAGGQQDRPPPRRSRQQGGDAPGHRPGPDR